MPRDDSTAPAPPSRVETGAPGPDIVLSAINAKWIHPSLALRLLKANLGGLEGRCEIMEFALRQPLPEKVEPLLAARPRILAFSVSIWNHLATLELLKALEERWAREAPAFAPSALSPAPRRPLVVLGGPEVSWLPGDAEIFRHADCAIRGEGETAFRELCEGFLSPGGMAPARIAVGGPFPEPGVPGARPFPARFIDGGRADLDAIDPGYRLYRDEDLRRKLVYVESSRGCPFGCEFCLSSRDTVPRQFPLEPFLDSLDGMIEKGVRTFKFLDRSFNLDIGRAKRILEFFLDRMGAARGVSGAANGRPRFQVHFEMVPFRFPPELKESLRRFPAGALRLELGIQTLNPQTAGLIFRFKEDPREELENIRFLRRETNALIHADLIAGLPGEGLASFGAGFDRLWEALSGEGSGNAASGPGGLKAACSGSAKGAEAPFEIQLGLLKGLPGTPILRRSLAWGMRYSPEPPYETIETGALPAGDIGKIKNFARFWELIVNRNPFPGLISRLLPPGEPVFDAFMEISAGLLARFGRNWGIDREDLRAYLQNL